MTPDQIHGALIIAAYTLGTLAAILLASLLVAAIDRSDSIDEHTRQHRESDQCPWCAASDPQPDLDRRIADARHRNQAAFEEALGLEPRVTDEALHEWMGDASC